MFPIHTRRLLKSLKCFLLLPRILSTLNGTHHSDKEWEEDSIVDLIFHDSLFSFILQHTCLSPSKYKHVNLKNCSKEDILDNFTISGDIIKVSRLPAAVLATLGRIELMFSLKAMM